MSFPQDKFLDEWSVLPSHTNQRMQIGFFLQSCCVSFNIVLAAISRTQRLIVGTYIYFMAEDLYSKLRQKCWNYALDSFGYSYIFDMRAAKYSRWIYWLNITAVIVPVIVGLTAIGYGYNTEILKKCIAIAIPLTILQFIFSLFAMFGKWDEKLAYSYEASQSHNFLYTRFKRLAEFPLENIQDLTHEFNLLETEANGRSKQDIKYTIKDWELRKGMRYALREFQRPCAGCNEIPLSMKSTNCDVCGNF